MSNRPVASSSAAARDGGAVASFVTFVACAATVVLVQVGSLGWERAEHRTLAFATFVALTLVLQVFVVDVYGRGTVGFSGAGLIAIGMTFGLGPAAAVAAVSGVVLLLRTRSRVHRGLFNAAVFALSAAAAVGAFDAFGRPQSGVLQVVAAVVAGLVYNVVNVGLLIVAMSLAEELQPLSVWRERYRWATPYYVAFGPIALALSVAYDRIGLVGMLAFTLPPAMMMLSMHQYVSRTRQSVEDVRNANDELRHANAALEERNADLHDLFAFAGGLAAQAHDRDALIAYAEETLGRLTGGPVRISTGLAAAGGEPLVVGGRVLGTVHVGPSARWPRLRDAVLPQLATALESSSLVDRVRKTHLETIAALSRSMEAKDYYTGGHTERVADVAVALARRLGYGGHDLDAIEIGALLHDIGKIGIPERILHKPGPLDDDEWRVMKEHPLISEYILSEVDLDPIVCQIARSSHERMDGAGYPDGLGGDEIPLAARIVLVADAFDALTSDRPYRAGRTVGAAIEELRAHRGTQFCPEVIDALEQLYREEPRVLGAAELRAISA